MIYFLILSFGFLFTHRMIQFHVNRKTLTEALSIQVIKILILFLWMLTLLSPWWPLPLTLFLLLLPPIMTNRLDWILNFILRHQFQQNLLSFIDGLILFMMSGKSFRDAFLLLTDNPQHFFHIKLRELLIAGNLQHLPQNFKYKEWKQIIELVQFMEKNPHQALDKLRAYRRQLHWQVTFQKKSKQATLQMRMQAFILSLLYIGLLIFVLNHQQKILTPLLFLSLGLFLTGLLFLFLLGRQKKWKT